MLRDPSPPTSTEPWLSIADLDGSVPIQDFLPSPGTTFTAWMSGRHMRDPDGLLQQFYDAFRFPDYFGWNFPALSDCLSDLAWLPADHFVLVIEEAQGILSEDVAALADFLDILLRTGERWSTAQRPDGSTRARFRTLLICDEPAGARLRDAALAKRRQQKPGMPGTE
ncbi:barstar family protein [Streptomyces sp. 71268]|uniref:barstar family protein n=1 Tax=Streptomyces sp. 71268 TaxID=3002640 RepID=UPI0023F96F70|nr:barstar family protein [Streptomyces sp. 71268]WEV25164.1 barstar family protein [Streptomyces sp. 71268]